MTFDVKKYPGYTEMIFRNRKPTLTRKKPIATMLTGDGLKVDMYDFYNKFYFFMKFDGLDEMVNVHNDLRFQATQREEAILYYQEKMLDSSINDVDRIIVNSLTLEQQPLPLDEAYLDYCKRYVKRKGLDLPTDNAEKQEEQNEIAPLSFNENAVDIVEDDEWAGFPPETNLEELKPEPMTPEDEAVFEPISQQQEITPNFKADKKSKKKLGKKKSKK